VPTPMRLRVVVAALQAADCSQIRQGANHTVWRCPCGEHQTAVPRHNQITAGVVGSIIRQLSCLSKGWLQ
jgi:hypothetical protein